MKITMLGTGTGLIRPERRSPAVLVETEDNTSVVVDCGWGVPEALNRMNFPLHRLGHLAVTHRHADHISAVPSLLHSQLIADIKRLPESSRKGALILHGYPGLSADVATLCNMMIPELDLDNYVTFVEHERNEPYRFGDLTVSALTVPHVESMPAISFCFEADGKKAVVTGDLGWNETILDQLQGANIAIMDASATQRQYEAKPIRNHLAPIQCGILAARAGVEHLVLTSLYDIDTIAEVTTAAQAHYRGVLTLPVDGQVFKL